MKKIRLRSVGELDAFLINFKTLFAYHSNKIENDEIDYHDTRDVFEDGRLVNFTGHPRTLFEVQNQLECYEFLKEKIVAKEPLSIELIKQIHYILTKGTYDEVRYNEKNERPGEYKKHDYIVGINEIGVAPEDVEEEMEALMDDIASVELKDEETVLQMACFFHGMLETIHPFADGNGRLGRTLLNYQLMIHDIAPVIIYDQDKKYYYECLDAFAMKDNLNPLFEFVKYQGEKTWERKPMRHKTFASVMENSARMVLRLEENEFQYDFSSLEQRIEAANENKNTGKVFKKGHEEEKQR